MKSHILLSHGGGGKLTRDLIQNRFLPAFSNPYLEKLGDSALLSVGDEKLTFTTDSYVVSPAFFPGGNIGELAIYGTVNDLSVMFSEPLFISAGFIIEEGFSLDKLDEILISMKEACIRAGVRVVTGDTKVVEKGKGDGIFINTSGIGRGDEKWMPENPPSPGDKIILNGTVGDHGIAVMTVRENLPVESEIGSDTAPLNRMILPLLKQFPGKIKFMRDATRGGVATVLNEIAESVSLGAELREESIPVREDTQALCDMLGLDPLYIANEGKAVFIVEKESGEEILEFMRTLPFGENSSIIGELTPQHPRRVILKTPTGGGRILDIPMGDQLPRIC